MRRIQVLEVLEASVGGAWKHVLQLLRGLDRERFDVHLACSAARDPGSAAMLEALRDEGIPVERVRMLRRPAPLADVAALRRLTRLIRAGRYDVVHTHCAKAGFLGRLAARRAGVPAVLHTPHCFPFQRVDTRLGPLYRALERRAARWCDRVVLVAESQRRVALDARLCDGAKLAVVENGIALPAEQPAALRQRYRRELGLGKADLAVALVGRITPQKDVQTFLSACDALLASLPQLRLFMVGATDNLPYLRSLRPPVADAALRVATGAERPREPVLWSPAMPVRLLGHRADAAELVAAFDAVVLCSHYEGLPYSLLEAMACAVPVVASDVTGCCDAVEEGRTGLLVPAGRAAAVAQGVAKLLADADLRRAMGAAARERVAGRFTQERFLRGLAGLYDSLLEC